ncbi:MAG: site-2 protease family protein [Anaerolineales bacterium]|nr:site-2 protease family protein [Anaerolineales bacterium]MCB0030374.1 site-2 protease family protein [Anaerolineales bacterium]
MYTVIWPQAEWEIASDRLKREIADLFRIDDVRRVGKRSFAFTGRLLHPDADAGYDEIQRRFKEHGYDPMLQEIDGEDVLFAQPQTLGQVNTGNPLINFLLFVATVFTTLSAGAAMFGVDLLTVLRSGDVARMIDAVLVGLPFAGALMMILGIHELGHYVAARWHGVKVTLPYFIPMPYNGIGTMGAFIALKTPMKNRKVLFDIGIAGPLAGFVVAVPVLLVGIFLSSVVPAHLAGTSLDMLGSSVLIDWLVGFVKEIPTGYTLSIHPIFFAGWLGMYLTGINLLPLGQLDGGHISYALFGRAAHTIAMMGFVGLILAGIFLSPNWFLWAFIVFLGGLRHPAPLNDLSRLDWARRLLGYAMIILFFLIVIPVPFGG